MSRIAAFQPQSYSSPDALSGPGINGFFRSNLILSSGLLIFFSFPKVALFASPNNCSRGGGPNLAMYVLRMSVEYLHPFGSTLQSRECEGTEIRREQTHCQLLLLADGMAAIISNLRLVIASQLQEQPPPSHRSRVICPVGLDKPGIVDKAAVSHGPSGGASRFNEKTVSASLL